MNKGIGCPPGWTSTQLSDAFVIDLGKMLSPTAIMSEDPKPYLANRNVLWNRFELDDIGYMDFSGSERQHFRLMEGDLLICEGGEIGRTAIWKAEIPECYFQKAIHRLRPRGDRVIDPRFFLHYMRHAIDSNLFHGLISRTSIAHLTREKLACFRVQHPESLSEQRNIAAIIDSLDEKIQTSTRLIAKQRDLRVASIRRLVAAGLACFDGIEASELHRRARRSNGSWSLVPLGSVLAGIDAGHSPDLEDVPAGPGQWGVLKVSAVGEHGFRPGENKVVDNQDLCNPALCVSSGDLLMTRANTSQLVGRNCIVQYAPPGLMLCDKTLRLTVDERHVPTRYVHIVLELAEVRRQIEIAATGTSGSMKNISQQSIRRLMIPMGSAQDVKRVVEIDTLHEAQIAALRREAEGLRLLKQGLMSDLLTGRVRTVAKLSNRADARRPTASARPEL